MKPRRVGPRSAAPANVGRITFGRAEDETNAGVPWYRPAALARWGVRCKATGRLLRRLEAGEALWAPHGAGGKYFVSRDIAVRVALAHNGTVVAVDAAGRPTR